MKKLSPSVKIYITLVVTLSALTAINAFTAQGNFGLAGQELPMPMPIVLMVNAAIMLVLYGGLGFIGLHISQKLAFADILDHRVSSRQRFLFPALSGIGIGLLFIVLDSLLSQFHPLGPLPHPPFPSSLIVSAIAAIGEEIIFRLFLISFGMWIISKVILKNRRQEQVFWIVAILSALAFSLGHLPSVMAIFEIRRITDIPHVLMLEIILLNGVLSLFAAYYFRRYGFLAAVGIHFWVDVVWHVIWGVF
jgi:membrane protease YdiL (CAAX protease family)